MKKILLIILYLILFTLIAILIYSQTNSFRKNLKSGIEYYVNKSINGSLHIQSIEGNIFTRLKINELDIKDSLNNKIAYIHSIDSKWNLIELINKSLLIESLELDSLNIYISQDKDFSYSLQNIVKKSQSKPSNKPLPLTIDIKQLNIHRSAAYLDLLEQKNIPESVLLNSSMSAKISPNSNSLSIQKLNIKTKNPDFELLNLNLDILHTPKRLRLKKLELKTKKTNLLANAEIPLNNMIESKASLSLKPLCLDEFKDFLSQKIHGSPEIKLNIYNSDRASHFSLNIKEQKQKINIKGSINSLAINTNYAANLNSDQLNLGYWINNNDLQTNINGHINIKGKNIDPKESSFTIKSRFTESQLENHTLDSIKLNINKNLDSIIVETQISSKNGDSNLKANITNVFNKIKYQIKSKVTNIEIGALSQKSNLHTKINGDINIEGIGIHAQEINSKLSIKLKSSKINDLEISNAHILAKINDGKYTLDTLTLNSNDIAIKAKGDGDKNHINSCKFQADIKSLNSLSSFIKMPAINLNGSIKGEVSGHKDSLALKSMINLYKIKYKTQKINKLKSHAKLTYIKEQLNGNLDLEILDAELSEDLTIKHFKSSQEIKNNVLNGIYNIQSGDSINLNTHIRVNKEDKDINMQISDFSLNAFSQEWTNKQDTAFCTLKPHKILFNEFNFSNKKQYISINGMYSFKDNEEKTLHLLSNDLDLSEFNYLLQEGQIVNGKLNSDLRIRIKEKDINYKGKINLTKGSLNIPEHGIVYDKINMDISLDKDNISIDSLHISSDSKGYLAIKGKTNIPQNYNDLMEEIDMSIIANNFTAIKSYNNQLIFNADSHIKGSIDKPIISGGLTLVRGKINLDPFIKSESVEDLDKPLLIEALEKAQKQKDTIHPTDNTIIKTKPLNIADINIFRNLRGKFYIDFPKNSWIESSMMKLELSGQIKMIKSKEEPEFFGDISLVRGFINISGRKFKLIEGKINLNGGSDINPSINIKMQYKFRDANKNLESLELIIAGTVKKPTFKFTLNEEFIEEKDAISYLIFGKKLDEIGSNDQNQISNHKDQLKPMLYSQVSNIFQKVLAKSLGLDNIEISGEDNWETGSITFGKYLTNDLYMGYSQLFSIDSQNKNLTPYRLIMEYHIIRSLLLKASNEGNKSGFDFVWKIKIL